MADKGRQRGWLLRAFLGQPGHAKSLCGKIVPAKRGVPGRQPDGRNDRKAKDGS